MSRPTQWSKQDLAELEHRGTDCLLGGDIHSAAILLGRALREGSETAARPFFVAITESGILGYNPSLIWQELFVPFNAEYVWRSTVHFRRTQADKSGPVVTRGNAKDLNFVTSFHRGQRIVAALDYMESRYLEPSEHMEQTASPPGLAERDSEYWNLLVEGWDSYDPTLLSELHSRIVENGDWLYISYFASAAACWFKPQPELCVRLVENLTGVFKENQIVHAELARMFYQIVELGDEYPDADDLLSTWRSRWPQSSRLAFATAWLHYRCGDEKTAKVWARKAFILDRCNASAAWILDTNQEKPIGFLGRYWNVLRSTWHWGRVRVKIMSGKLPDYAGISDSLPKG